MELAQAFCAQRERGFDIVRSEIWPNEYRIAFRCPRIMPDPVAEALSAPAAAPLPAPEPTAATPRNRRGVPTSPGLF